MRSAIGVIVLAGLIFAFQWYKSRESDPYGGSSMDTTGWVAAIETVGDGQHAVAFKQDGTLVQQPNPPAESQDRDPAWRPDGNYLFFSSNREKGKPTMFRWFPDGRGSAEMRSPPGPVQDAPFFLASEADRGGSATGLITGSGTVMEYDPKKPALHQVLPPPDPKNREQEGKNGEGQMSPFEALYNRFGTSFRVAKWTPDKKAVFAVMRRETGEILIYQKLDYNPDKPGDSAPKPIVAGDRVDFDIDQTTGLVFLTIQNFQWPFSDQVPPQFIKNGKATVPYRHAIAIFDVSKTAPMQVIVKSDVDKDVFGTPAISPQGDKLAVVHGSYAGSGNVTPDSILMFGLAGDVKGQAGKVAVGEVFEPNWSPDGKKLAYAKRESKTVRSIYVADVTNGVTERRSPNTGVFGNPVFSPQIPKQ